MIFPPGVMDAPVHAAKLVHPVPRSAGFVAKTNDRRQGIIPAFFRQISVFHGSCFSGNLELRFPFRNRADFPQHEDSAGEQ
jgi:hypothetical protein